MLTKVYDQNTPENIFPQNAKYKSGYDYCYVPPFIFSPDGNKVLVHKCLWEGSEVMLVDAANLTTKELDIPVGFGSQLIGWLVMPSYFMTYIDGIKTECTW